MNEEALREVVRLKADMIAKWDPRKHTDQPVDNESAELQGEAPERPPKGGFAVGHSVGEAGDIRIELRVSAAGGPNYQKAMELKRIAELQGFQTVLRIFGAPPSISVGTRRQKNQPCCFGGRRHPLHIGASVAHEQCGAGTLGAFVTAGEEKWTGILSCTHVLAFAGHNKQVRRGDPIQQPGLPEPVPARNRIAELTDHFAPFIDGRTDNLDAAVARLDDRVEAIGNVIPNDPRIPPEFHGRPLGAPVMNPVRGARVIRIARTTGFGRGEVLAIDFENFRPKLGNSEPFTFGSVYEISWLDGESATERGDSGSLILTEEGLHPIGIHFCAVPLADGALASYVIPWNRIAAEFPVKLC